MLLLLPLLELSCRQQSGIEVSRRVWLRLRPSSGSRGGAIRQV